MLIPSPKDITRAGWACRHREASVKCPASSSTVLTRHGNDGGNPTAPGDSEGQQITKLHSGPTETLAGLWFSSSACVLQRRSSHRVRLTRGEGEREKEEHHCFHQQPQAGDPNLFQSHQERCYSCFQVPNHDDIKPATTTKLARLLQA